MRHKRNTTKKKILGNETDLIRTQLNREKCLHPLTTNCIIVFIYRPIKSLQHPPSLFRAVRPSSLFPTPSYPPKIQNTPSLTFLGAPDFSPLFVRIPRTINSLRKLNLYFDIYRPKNICSIASTVSNLVKIEVG